ncbi:hypothetical protein [Budvicia diplopodorum]|uniref:hypothetical protein n=1 Tax=Budvicia diplopodorum TaxID=1119056 RepID=UPI001358AD76|nr:hypothetical protein [Budvicia diplopodorum]
MPLTFSVPGGKCPVPGIGFSAVHQCGSRSPVIQHNVALREMGLNGPQRVTNVMSAPLGLRALRGCISNGERLAAGCGIAVRRGAQAAPLLLA